MMKPERILSSDLLDILFDGRNKDYGAYALRKGYRYRLLFGLCSIPLMAGLFLGANYLNRNFQTASLTDLLSDSAVIKLIQINEPEPMKPPEAAPKQKPVASIKDATPVIVPNETKADPTPTVDELEDDNRAISTETVDGDPPASSTSPATAEPGGTGEVQATEPPQPVVEKVAFSAEVMPEFPGGIDALRRFLGRHLRVPEETLEAGQQVKIPVRFVVNKNGELSDVEFLVQVDDIYKKEIMRVMKKMPKWKPGIQNGRQVAVYFMIPIIFQTGE